MLRDIKKLALAVAGAALLGLGSTAHAFELDYYVTGAFTGPGASSTATTAAYNVTGDGGSATLTYDFLGSSGSPIDVGIPGDVSLGQFTFTGTGNVLESFSTVGFTLSIYQTSPVGGPGTLAATLTGTLSNPPATSHLDVVFASPATVSIPSSPVVTYAITNLITDNSVDNGDFGYTINAGFPTTIEALTTVAPLPQTAGTAAALLGCVGAFSVIRRRVMA